MRAVIDTNVFVSGLLLPNSVPGQIVAALRRGDFRMASSEPMLAELGAVLAYPKLQKHIGWDADAIGRYLSLLRFEADVVSIESETAEVPADPADTMILRTLLASQADCLVSGDYGILPLASHDPIITPRLVCKAHLLIGATLPVVPQVNTAPLTLTSGLALCVLRLAKKTRLPHPPRVSR